MMKMKACVWTLLFVCLSSSGFGVSPSVKPDECSSMTVRLRGFRLITSPCNFTTLKDKSLQSIQGPAVVVYLPVLYLVAFSLGLPSNLLALWVLLFRTKRLPSTVLLINLTAADCLLLLVLPFRIVYHFRGNHWDLGEPFCRLVTAVFYGNMYGSVLCLALVALDRYIALVHPFGAKTLRSRRTSVHMTAAVWAVVVAAMLPLLLSRQTYWLEELQITTCHDALPEAEHENFFLPYFASLFAVCFALPLGLVLFCHVSVLRTLLAEGKRYGHAVHVTVLVLLVFVVCLLPSNVLLLLTYADVWDSGDELYEAYMFSLALSTFNSVIDPFIFYYVSPEFREKAVAAICCRQHREDKPSSSGNVSYSSSSGLRSKVTILSKTSNRQTSESQTV